MRGKMSALSGCINKVVVAYVEEECLECGNKVITEYLRILEAEDGEFIFLKPCVKISRNNPDALRIAEAIITESFRPMDEITKRGLFHNKKNISKVDPVG
ncbi:MAG: hypothetical protein NT136_04310 [Candidatus Moranbacteria bacterium]|nr:hypothetical protein [Candidatus Moranbacteria bacterium]